MEESQSQNIENQQVLAFTKSLIYAQRRPSFFVNANTQRGQSFLKANTWSYNTLSSPWKLALDQSITFH